MAIEWWTRVNQEFSISDLFRSTLSVLDDIGFPDVELRLEPESVSGDMVRSSRSDIDFRISTTDGMHSTTCGFQDFGSPDDPELGGWITVTPWRDNLSIVLSLATIISAAKLTRSPVVDESQLLGARQQGPEDLVAAIMRHYVDRFSSPTERARSLLRSFQPRLLIADRP